MGTELPSKPISVVKPREKEMGTPKRKITNRTKIQSIGYPSAFLFVSNLIECTVSKKRKRSITDVVMGKIAYR